LKEGTKLFIKKCYGRVLTALFFLTIIGVGIICFTQQTETDKGDDKVIKIHLKPLGRLACFCDKFLEPFMRIISVAWDESPQRTHRWNNYHLGSANVAHFNRKLMVCHNGIPGETSIYPLFHIPVLGGWRNYVVLMPIEKPREWYVGWIAGNVVGVSRIPLSGPVRLLVGPGPVCWFGVNAKGDQLPIRQVGVGRIGEGGKFAKEPLL